LCKLNSFNGDYTQKSNVQIWKRAADLASGYDVGFVTISVILAADIFKKLGSYFKLQHSELLIG